MFVKVRTLGEREWVLDGVADREVRLDAQRMTQAMVQLAQNAVQHTAPGGRIRIGSRAVGSRAEAGRDRAGRAEADLVELYVADHGPGIPPQDAEVIFERFRRGTSRRGTRTSGAGLGLAIVRAIAEGHHGHVELRPTEGGGATFVLTLETG